MADQNTPALEGKQVRARVMLQEAVFGFNVCIHKTSDHTCTEAALQDRLKVANLSTWTSGNIQIRVACQL